jgi:DNA-binding response OmpR family regulator
LDSNVIPVHVHHLRRKLVDAGASAEIHTVRGVGYLLSEVQALCLAPCDHCSSGWRCV